MTDLASEIASDADMIARDYPRGATLSDLAGYYGSPLPAVEAAIEELRAEGVSLPFLKGEKDPAAVAMGKRGGAARASSMTPEERSDIARRGAAARWGGEAEPIDLITERLDEMKQRLPELAERYPNGASSGNVAEFFKVTRAQMLPVLAIAEEEGWAKRVRKMTGGPPQLNKPCVYVFTGMNAAPAELPERQERVMGWIREHAKFGDRLEINMRRLAQELNLPEGLSDTLWSLECRGLLRRISPYPIGGNKGSPIYEVTEPPEYPAVQLKEPPPLRVRSDGRSMGRQMRTAKAQLQRPPEDMVEILKWRRRFLREELQSVESLLRHYNEVFETNETAAELGRRGGLKGGPARASRRSAAAGLE